MTSDNEGKKAIHADVSVDALVGGKAKKKAKPKKKSLEKAADVALGPTGQAVLTEMNEELNRVATEGYEAGVPVFLGAATVSLHMEFENASTPVDAVNQALIEIAYNGTRAYTFLVRDEVTQMLYAVHNGQMVSLEEARIEDQEE